MYMFQNLQEWYPSYNIIECVVGSLGAWLLIPLRREASSLGGIFFYARWSSS
jgi:hypothetical protein